MTVVFAQKSVEECFTPLLKNGVRTLVAVGTVEFRRTADYHGRKRVIAILGIATSPTACA